MKPHNLKKPIKNAKNTKNTKKAHQDSTTKIPKDAQKAYKLLALQENISNNEAKDLIDMGLVSVCGKKIKIARGLLSPNVKFIIDKPAKVIEIFRDSNILALNKPAFLTSEEVAKSYPQWTLLHRLDKETSGILLLVKENSEFHIKAKEAFKNLQVYKKYIAIVDGILEEECEVSAPLIIKKGRFAKVSVSKNGEGQKAISIIKPLEICGKKTKVEVEIKTGKTHQIRVHLAHIKHPIIGDMLYGTKESKRILLHAEQISLLGYDFSCPAPSEFNFN